MDLEYDICLVELASPMVESEVVGFADLPPVAKVLECSDRRIWAVLHYMSSWDWVGMYFKMVGMDPNRCATL